jgi:hypothetical protein
MRHECHSAKAVQKQSKQGKQAGSGAMLTRPPPYWPPPLRALCDDMLLPPAPPPPPSSCLAAISRLCGEMNRHTSHHAMFV